MSKSRTASESTLQSSPGLLQRRFVSATRFSFAGLARVWREEAFRVEVFLGLALLPIALWAPDRRLESAVLVGVLIAVLVVETLNTAIEEAINRIGLEINPLSKAAKDLGSAAVLLMIIGACIVWLLVLWP